MFTVLPEAISKQFIDDCQVRTALLDAERRAVNYRGSMFWNKVGEKEYLYRKYDQNRTKSLGLRSPETESIYEKFRQEKSMVAERLARLRDVSDRYRRINAAIHVGRTPNLAIKLLEEIRKAGLADHFLVIGTNALFAYETYGNGRFDGDITTTEDADLLWDSRKHLTLMADADDDFRKDGLLGLVRKVDPTFNLVEGEFRAANANGYMIDLIKRRPKSLFDDKEPQQLFKHENDFWASKIHSMEWLLSAPRFTQTIVGVNGTMAEMTTIDPRAFVLYKLWLSQRDDRNPEKKPRDLAQARAVYHLITEHLPLYDFSEATYLPERMRNEGVFKILEGKSIQPSRNSGVDDQNGSLARAQKARPSLA